jgi:hypothetical protein
MTNNTTTLIELIADSGYIISNGFENLGKKVYLPLNTDISNYKQVLESQIIDPSILNEFELYKKRKADGENAYLTLSAEFRILKQNGTISEATHNAIEEILTPVRNEVMFGQWKKGLEILTDIGNAQVGQTLYDRLHLLISTYILENY